MKKRMYCVFAVSLLALTAAFLPEGTAFADRQPPTLEYDGCQLNSRGSIVYCDEATGRTVKFCSEDLYRIAEKINALHREMK